MRVVLIVSLAWVGLAAADKPKDAFPAAPGTKLTFEGRWDKQTETWSTALSATGDMVQFDPHHDVANYFSKSGFRVAGDGIYIRGESLDEPPAPALAIAFPLKAGASHQVPGLIPTTYKVVSHAKLVVKAGTFDAWKIEISDKPNGKGAVWIAPGTGIVKIQLPTGRTDELVKLEAPR